MYERDQVERSSLDGAAPAARPHAPGKRALSVAGEAAALDSEAKEPPSIESRSRGGVPRRTKRALLRWSLFALLPLALAGGGSWYVAGGRMMSTDDAYVEADKVGISTDVSGVVQQVDVGENQQVRAGQLLYRLDPLPFQIALDNARANLAETALTVESMKADYRRMLSDIDTQQAQVQLDQSTYDRAATLVKSGTVAQSNYDQARFTLQADKSKVVALKQLAQVQLARLGGDPNVPTVEHPQYLQARAQLDEAQRQLDHATVTAPFAGTVTNVPAIAPGKYLPASTTAFYLVATDHAWVDSNPKETDLTYVRPGQPVMIAVDSYPHLEWHGTVESISPAAAQEFQLLPAQNTSGNWVKVVQRIPMRVRIDTSDARLPPLRAGMSVEVDVDTGHSRGLPHFLTALLHLWKPDDADQG